MAANPDDLQDFYEASLGPSRKLAVTDAATAAFSDADGPLLPGRYLVLLRAAAGSWIWIQSRIFVKGTPPGAPTLDAPSIPLSPDLLSAVEYNVRKGVNDQIAAKAESGKSGTLYFIRISRVPTQVAAP